MEQAEQIESLQNMGWENGLVKKRTAKPTNMLCTSSAVKAVPPAHSSRMQAATNQATKSSKSSHSEYLPNSHPHLQPSSSECTSGRRPSSWGRDYRDTCRHLSTIDVAASSNWLPFFWLMSSNNRTPSKSASSPSLLQSIAKSVSSALAIVETSSPVHQSSST